MSGTKFSPGTWLDVINGYLILSKKLYFNTKKYSGSWNFGPSESNKTVKKIAEEFKKNSELNFNIKISQYENYF